MDQDGEAVFNVKQINFFWMIQKSFYIYPTIKLTKRTAYSRQLLNFSLENGLKTQSKTT